MRTLAYLRAFGLSLAALAAVTSSAACDSPCVALAKEVCKCEPTEDEQRACVQRVEDEAAVVTPSEAEEKRCDELIGECQCDELAQGNLAACGLSDDPGSN